MDHSEALTKIGLNILYFRKARGYTQQQRKRWTSLRPNYLRTGKTCVCISRCMFLSCFCRFCSPVSVLDLSYTRIYSNDEARKCNLTTERLDGQYEICAAKKVYRKMF